MDPAALEQCKAVSGVLVLGMVQGMAVGWSSPGLAKLHRGEGPFKATLSEAANIASMFSLGLLAGFVVSSIVSARTGRKQTLLLAPLAFAGWVVLTAFGTSVTHLALGRALAGVGHSVAIGFSFIYVSEVVTSAKRGELMLAITLLMPIGQLIAFAVGPLVSFRVQALMPIPFLVLVLVLMGNYMPESPFYLATVGQQAEMLAALRKVRTGVPDDVVRQEAATIQRTVKQQQMDASSWKETFSAPGSRRAAGIVLVINSSLAILGVTSVLAFATQIFQESGTPLSAESSSTLLIIINVCMVLVAMKLIERLGRRLQLVISALGNSASIAALSAFFFARDVFGVDVADISWVPLTSLVCFTASTGLGVVAIPGMLMTELLGQRAKAIIGPACGVIVSLTSFVVHRSFLPLGKSYGFWLPFSFYALANLLYGIFTMKCVPETKGKSLAEVQEMLRGGRSRSAGKGKKD